jgi:hypothetical protein
MSKQDDLMIITDTLISKLSGDITALQQDALRLSSEHNFEKCGAVLKLQRAAIDELIALTKTANDLQCR